MSIGRKKNVSVTEYIVIIIFDVGEEKGLISRDDFLVMNNKCLEKYFSRHMPHD